MDQEREWRLQAVIKEAEQVVKASETDDMSRYDFSPLLWALVALKSYEKTGGEYA